MNFREAKVRFTSHALETHHVYRKVDELLRPFEEWGASVYMPDALEEIFIFSGVTQPRTNTQKSGNDRDVTCEVRADLLREACFFHEQKLIVHDELRVYDIAMFAYQAILFPLRAALLSQVVRSASQYLVGFGLIREARALLEAFQDQIAGNMASEPFPASIGKITHAPHDAQRDIERLVRAFIIGHEFAHLGDSCDLISKQPSPLETEILCDKMGIEFVYAVDDLAAATDVSRDGSELIVRHGIPFALDHVEFVVEIQFMLAAWRKAAYDIAADEPVAAFGETIDGALFKRAHAARDCLKALADAEPHVLSRQTDGPTYLDLLAKINADFRELLAAMKSRLMARRIEGSRSYIPREGMTSIGLATAIDSRLDRALVGLALANDYQTVYLPADADYPGKDVWQRYRDVMIGPVPEKRQWRGPKRPGAHRRNTPMTPGQRIRLA